MAQPAAQTRPTTASDHPWLASYPPDVAWDRPLPRRPASDILARTVARFPDRPCFDFLGRRMTYAEVGGLVERAARGLQLLGVVKGTRVGLCLPNSPYYLIAYYAILRAGGTVVNFCPIAAEPEIARQVEDSGTEVMFVIDLALVYPRVAASLGKGGLRHLVVCPLAEALPTAKGAAFRLLKRREMADWPADGRHTAFRRLIANDGRPRPVAVEPDDEAVLQYTGGTTGTPKGAVLTHANISANTQQVLSWFPGIEPGRERILSVLPFFHVFAMTVAMNLGVAAGAELVMLPRFDLRQLLKTVKRRRPTLVPGVPTLYKAVADHPRIRRYDLSCIKFCISGGAPLPLEVKQAFEALTGCTLVEGYGLTEASPVVTCNPISGVNKAGSIGIPLPRTRCEIRALDGSGRTLPAGEKGELCVAGPQVMAGYADRPEETAQVLSDGWLRTGDVGYMDGDGYVFLVDRIKDVILCSGFNVYPRMVEEAIYQHPAVGAATVIGIPDDYRGQAPKAFVQLRPGTTASAEELLAFLRQRLSPIEMPVEVEFRAELPRTAVGKLSKKELVDEELARRGVGS